MSKQNITKRVYKQCADHLYSLELGNTDFSDNEIDFANAEKERIMLMLTRRSEYHQRYKPGGLSWSLEEYKKRNEM